LTKRECCFLRRHNSPAASSVPGSNPTEANSQSVTVHFEDPPDIKKSPPNLQKSPFADEPSKTRLPFCNPSFFPPFPRLIINLPFLFIPASNMKQLNYRASHLTPSICFLHGKFQTGLQLISKAYSMKNLAFLTHYITKYLE